MQGLSYDKRYAACIRLLRQLNTLPQFRLWSSELAGGIVSDFITHAQILLVLCKQPNFYRFNSSGFKPLTYFTSDI